jgi:hypothetical protein
LVACGVVVVAFVVGIAVGAVALSGKPKAPPERTAAASHSVSATPQRRAGPKRRPNGSSINSAATDPKSLTVAQVFPNPSVKIAGHPFTLRKAQLSTDCAATANGPFAAALTKQRCSRVVRATFVSKDGKYAATAGIAVLPTARASVAAERLAVPSRYEWFRGMPATGATKIDRAGGDAFADVRGRYIIYSYAMNADGKAAGKSATIRAIMDDLCVITAVPINARAAAGT